MDRIKLDYSKVLSFVGEKEIAVQREKATKALKGLEDGTCKGSDFLGWLDLPVHITDDELNRISACANKLREQTDVVVIVGIGGSYLGAKAVIEAMSGSFDAYSGTKVVFAGNNVSEDYLYELQTFLKDKKFGICVISKSGTTTEPAVAFRLLKDQLIEQEGVTVARERIVAITDEKKGALRTMSDREGYETFVIPDNVGGRYSVLTPVGLLPVAIAGFDVRALVKGAVDMRAYGKENGAELSATYAAVRNALYEKGYVIENIDATIIAQRPKLAAYRPQMAENIAHALKLPVNRVSVKATTEEGLGFTGTGEGISSQAITLLTSVEDYCYDDRMKPQGCSGCQGCAGQK